MKAVLKAHLPGYLVLLVGVVASQFWSRFDHRGSPLEWHTVRGIVGGTAIISIVFFIYCLIIWIRNRPQSST